MVRNVYCLFLFLVNFLEAASQPLEEAGCWARWAFDLVNHDPSFVQVESHLVSHCSKFSDWRARFKDQTHAFQKAAFIKDSYSQGNLKISWSCIVLTFMDDFYLYDIVHNILFWLPVLCAICSMRKAIQGTLESQYLHLGITGKLQKHESLSRKATRFQVYEVCPTVFIGTCFHASTC